MVVEGIFEEERWALEERVLEEEVFQLYPPWGRIMPRAGLLPTDSVPKGFEPFERRYYEGGGGTLGQGVLDCKLNTTFIASILKKEGAQD